MKKRLLSMLMVLAMVISLIPVQVLAAPSTSNETYDAYYYILNPDEGTSPTRDASAFTFVGQGSVDSMIGPPNGQSKGQTLTITDANRGYMTAPQVEVSQSFGSGGNQITQKTYPSIYFEGKDYHYAGNPNITEGQNTYSITWYRYSSSVGFNIEETPFNSSGYEGYCWHVDGYVTLSDKVSVTYQVQFPGSDSFSNVSANGDQSDTAFVEYVEENTLFSEVTQPNMPEEKVIETESGETITYTFDGWYYDAACTQKVSDTNPITKDETVYGKYVTETVSGDSYINIEVYVDGDPLQLTTDNWSRYIGSVEAAGGTPSLGGEPTVVDGKLRYTYEYENYNAADILFAPSAEYVLQGVYGTFIYGMSGWNSPSKDAATGKWTIDNVKGTTTLKVYLNTPYTVTYVVPEGTEAPVDAQTYITKKALDNFTPPSFADITDDSFTTEKNEGRNGGWVDNDLKTTITLNNVPDGCIGWYTTANGTTLHETTYSGEAIKTAAENADDGTPRVIECYAIKQAPGLDVTKSADKTSAGLNDTITYTITVANTGNTALNNVVVTDSLMNGTISVRSGDKTITENVNGSYTIATLGEGTTATITYQYAVTQSDMERGELVNAVKAKAGETGPEDTDSVTVLTGTITITPADITVYTGGNGYTGVVTGDDGGIVGENTEQGLPEPGYYITLPDTVNERIQSYIAEQGGSSQEDASGYVDLSGILRFSYDFKGETRAWSLELYSQTGDSEGNSGAFTENRYIYRMVTVQGDYPVRLRFAEYDADRNIIEGSYVSSDEFEVGLDTLYKEYAMTIYPGALQQDEVQATIQLGDETYTFDIGITPGNLTIRGTTDNAVTETVGSDTSGSGFAAAVPAGTYYTINGSDVQVDRTDAIALLVDDLVTEGSENASDVLAALQNATSSALENKDITVTNPTYEMKYMDLVDTNNGNVYVTAKAGAGENAEVTVTWPMPKNADQNETFYVVHFKDLNRNFGNVLEAVTQADIEVLPAEKTEDGIQFTTTSFSPFVLVYSQGTADLEVEKSLTKVNGEDYTSGSVSVGDELTYTITVTNNGTLALSDIRVTDTMSNGQTVNWVSLPEGVTQNTDGTLTIASLSANGGSVTLTATYVVQRSDANSNLSNTVKVTAGTTEDGTTTPTTPVDPIRPPIHPVDPPELNTEDHYAYIVGYPDGNVKPEGNITRAEVATIFFRLLTDESRDEFWSQTNPYSDVSEDDWYNNAVSTLTNAGIIDGYEDGTFKPNGNITRAEFATIAVRFFEATYEGENLFPDIDGHWAQDYINEAANAGIVDGYPDGTFGPQKRITRAEAMTMVNRTIDRHPHEDHLLADMIVWPDNPETAWYYEQVQEATNSHEYTMNTDDEQNPYEIWTELLPVRDWEQLEKEWSDAHSGQSGGDVV